MDQNNQKMCPYLSIKTMKCRICSGGLFIPLNDHIEIYCKTPMHTQCLQYSMQSENIAQRLENAGKRYKNRRKYHRVPADKKVTLVKLLGSERIVTHHPISAHTLDLSMGGMRLQTDTPLVNDSVMHFSLETLTAGSPHRGVGRVAWCNKQIDEPGYQIGIVFKDEQFKQSMEAYLNSQNQQS
jgi:hypothetical protein